MADEHRREEDWVRDSGPILCETLRLFSATSAYRLLRIARRCLAQTVPSAGPLSPGDSPGQSVGPLSVTNTFFA